MMFGTDRRDAFKLMGAALLARPDRLASPAAAAEAADSAARTAAVVNVVDFGARADGKTDASPAFQAAVDRLRREGQPGIVLIPPAARPYRLERAVDLSLAHDVTLIGPGAAVAGGKEEETCFTTLPDGATPFWSLPFHDLIGRYEIGDTSLELADGNARKLFRPGDPVIIRTGGIVPGWEKFTPIAEINLVEAVDGKRIELRLPITKPFFDRKDGLPFGIANARERVTMGLAILGLRIVNRHRRGADLFDCLHLNLAHCRFEGRGALAARGRFLSLHYHCALRPSWKKPIWRPYYLALDTCTSDVDADVTASSSSIGTVHIHEGVANARLRLLAHQGREAPPESEPWPVVSIRGLSWNVSLENPTIINSPAAPAILSSEASRYPGEGNSGLRIAGGYVAGLVQGAAVAHLGKTAEPMVQGLQAEDARVAAALKQAVHEILGQSPLTLAPAAARLGASHPGAPHPREGGRLAVAAAASGAELAETVLLPPPRARSAELRLHLRLDVAAPGALGIVCRPGGDGGKPAVPKPAVAETMVREGQREAEVTLSLPVSPDRPTPIQLTRARKTTSPPFSGEMQIVAAAVRWRAG